MDKEVLLVIDITKGKSDRSGLIQQVVTYVKDGRTVTRKQWVRSGFADHAKLANEQKKKDEEDKKQDEKKMKKEKHILEDDAKLSHTIDVKHGRGKGDISEDGIKHGRNKKVLEEMKLKHKKKKHKKKHEDRKDKRHGKGDK